MLKRVTSLCVLQLFSTLPLADIDIVIENIFLCVGVWTITPLLPEMTVQLQLSLLQAEDLLSCTPDLEIVPKGCEILAGSRGVNIAATPVAKDIWEIVLQTQFWLALYKFQATQPKIFNVN